MEIKTILSSLPAKPFVFNHKYSIPSQMLGSSRNISTTQVGATRTLLHFQFNIQNRLMLTEFAVFKRCIMRRSRKFCQRGSNFDNF